VNVEAEIYESLIELLQAFVLDRSPELPVAYPGVTFTPPDNGQWLEVRMFPNETQNYGLANTGVFIHRGFMQVTVCERPGGGITAGLALAGEVVDAFDKGTEASPALVTRRPWISSVLSQPDRTMYPVTIPYEAAVNG
jgi:hypothetical protein